MIYFISGHRDLLQSEFNETYVPKIDRVLKADPYAEFVIGDYEGVDIAAQRYIASLGFSSKITVYHMFDSPRFIASQDIKTVGGFKDDISRDSAMTNVSDFDIAFYRKSKGNSGTFQNIKRRGIL